MPQVLHDPPRDLVVQIRVEQPLSIVQIVGPRPRENLCLGDGKLGAARGRDGTRHRRVIAAEEVDVGVGKYHVGHVVGIAAERLDLVRAAGHFGAAQVRVAVLADVVEAEAADGLDVIIVLGVVVPGLGHGLPVRVQEDHDAGQVVVVGDDECQVRHCFVAFVGRWV